MSKSTFQNRFHKLIENADSSEIENKYVQFTTDAIDDIFLKGNKGQGMEKLRISIKFMHDEYEKYPKLFRNAWLRIDEYMIKIFKTDLHPIMTLVKKERLLILNIFQLSDLINIVWIEKCLHKYKLTQNEKYLYGAMDHLTAYKELKLFSLDPETLPEALQESDLILEEHEWTKDKEINKLIRMVLQIKDEKESEE